MKKLRKLIIFQIFLAALLLLIVIYYLIQRNENIMPYTEIFLTNTSIIGKVIGVG